MQEEADSDLMHVNGFRKGEGFGFANETAEALAKRVVETLHLIRGTFSISGPMLSDRQDVVIALQGVGIQSAWRYARGMRAHNRRAVASSRGPRA